MRIFPLPLIVTWWKSGEKLASAKKAFVVYSNWKCYSKVWIIWQYKQTNFIFSIYTEKENRPSKRIAASQHQQYTKKTFKRVWKIKFSSVDLQHIFFIFNKFNISNQFYAQNLSCLKFLYPKGIFEQQILSPPKDKQIFNFSEHKSII